MNEGIIDLALRYGLGDEYVVAENITDRLTSHGVREYDITESTDGTVEIVLGDHGLVAIRPTGEGDGWDFTVRGPDGSLNRDEWVTDGDWLAREVAQLVRLAART